MEELNAQRAKFYQSDVMLIILSFLPLAAVIDDQIFYVHAKIKFKSIVTYLLPCFLYSSIRAVSDGWCKCRTFYQTQLARDTRGLTHVRSDLEPSASESVQCGFFLFNGLLCYKFKFESYMPATELDEIVVCADLYGSQYAPCFVTSRFTLSHAVESVVMLLAHTGVSPAYSPYCLSVISAFMD